MRNYQSILPVLIFALFLSLSSFAQEAANEGLDAYERGDFKEAKIAFTLQMQNKKTRTAGEYGMALLLSNRDYDGYDIYEAFLYANSAKTTVQEANKRELYRLEDLKIKKRDISKLAKAVAAKAVEDARAVDSETEYNNLLDQVSLRITDRKAIQKRRDSLAVQKAQKQDTYRAYGQVLEQYGKMMRRSNRNLFKEVERLQFMAFIKEKGFDKFNQFATENPKHHFVKDSGRKAYLAIYKSTKANDFRQFVRQNPSSVYVPFAKEKIAKYQIEEKREDIKKATGYRQYLKLILFLKPMLDQKDWAKALAEAQSFENSLKDSEYYQDLIQLLEAPAQDVQVNSLGPGLNSKGKEYSPTISGDGKTLFFCGAKRGNNLGNEDIFFSKKVDGVWQKAELLRDLSTIDGFEAPQSVAIDGSKLLVFQNGRLAFSEKKADGWGALERYSRTINFGNWQSDGSISASGQHLIFVSDQGADDYDIFVSFKKDNGEWGKPINLGDQINTIYPERDPFLHPDMKTLYFSSAGRGGLGNLDVFVSTRLDSTWTNWSKPKNLGREFNTTSRDWGYKITTEGDRAIFAATIPDKGPTEDIYEAILPENLRPNPVVTLTGKIDGLEKLQSATILLRDQSTGEIIGEYISDPNTGEYFVAVPLGIDPVLSVEHPDIISSIQPLDKIADAKEGQSIKLDITVKSVQKLESGEEIQVDFKDVLFDSAESDIKASFRSSLDQMVAFIQKHSVKVRIEGHTDNVGGKSYNQKLSNDRANAVRDYLIEKGCEAKDISAKGFGEIQPVADNTSESGRSANRRVTFRITKE